MKYDNTLLYDKNVQKDEKIGVLNADIMEARGLLESEKSRTSAYDKELRYA